MDNQLLITIFGGLFGLAGAIASGVLIIKQIKVKGEAQRLETTTVQSFETLKDQALAKAESVKAETDAETKRLDAIINLVVKQVENLQEENKGQRQEMIAIREGGEATRAKLDLCLDEKAKESSRLHTQITDLELARREDKAMMTAMQKELEKQKAMYEAVEQQIKGRVKIEDATIEGKTNA